MESNGSSSDCHSWAVLTLPDVQARPMFSGSRTAS